MKVTGVNVQPNPQPLLDATTAAFYAAAAEVRDEAKANAAAAKSHNPRTGTLSASIKLWRRKRKDRPTATIGSRKSPYVTVMERGGRPYGPRRPARPGPHVDRANAPRFIGRAVEKFSDRYTKQLRGAKPGLHAGYMDLGRRQSLGSATGIMAAYE